MDHPKGASETGGARLDPTDPGCFRDRRHRAGQKTLDRVASLGNLEVKRQATWGMSDKRIIFMNYISGSVMAAMLIATVSGCAKRPEEIAAIQMDTSSYSNLSCRQLAQEETKIRNDLDALSAQQNSAATSDAWGVFLLGVPWSSMSGNDKEALIAVAKGRLDAIDLVQVSKSCE